MLHIQHRLLRLPVGKVEQPLPPGLIIREQELVVCITARLWVVALPQMGTKASRYRDKLMKGNGIA